MAISLNAQISYADSTVQAITYWNMSEIMTYAIIFDRYKVSQSDTIKRVIVE